MRTILHAFGTFARGHDDIPAFHAGYLLLTFLAAALFNLGICAIFVCGHMSLDLYKYRDVHHYTWMQTVRATMLESLVDLMLLALLFTAGAAPGRQPSAAPRRQSPAAPSQQPAAVPAQDKRADALKKFLEGKRLEQAGNYSGAVGRSEEHTSELQSQR